MSPWLPVVPVALLCCSTMAEADVLISSRPTQNMSCGAGVCTATAQKAVLNVGDIQAMLASGDVTVKTGSLASDILVNQPVTWSTDSRLILDARRTITAKEPITVTGTGGLGLVYGDGDSSGDLQFFGEGKADLPNPGSSLIINGSVYTLVYDIAGLANGILNDPSGHFALAVDYDATGQVFKSSPILSFAGTLEGLGHAIAHVSIRYRGDEQIVGFFGSLTGTVRDILLADENLTARDVDPAAAAGGFVGINQGNIIHARATGRFNGNVHYAGGLVGYNEARILKSSAAMTIRAKAAGGLVGNNYGYIDQSFAGGRIFAPAGGLVADDGGYKSDPDITNSYAIAHLPAGAGGLIGTGVAFVISSYSASKIPEFGFSGSVYSNHAHNDYWDVDRTNTTSGCGWGDCSNITGLTDVELKSELPAGFDPAIWTQGPRINHGYPYLLANPPPKRGQVTPLCLLQAAFSRPISAAANNGESYAFCC